jgi:hypothetical protein
LQLIEITKLEAYNSSLQQKLDQMSKELTKLRLEKASSTSSNPTNVYHFNDVMQGKVKITQSTQNLLESLPRSVIRNGRIINVREAVKDELRV